jgi:hypothetical protein
MKKLRELLSQTPLPANLSERESNLKHFPRLQRVPRGELLFPRPTSAPHRIQGAEFHSPIPGVLSLSAYTRPSAVKNFSNKKSQVVSDRG